MTIRDLLRDYRIYHSDFQLNYFIVGGNVTDYGRYMQALREINGRKTNIENMEDEKRLLELDISEATYDPGERGEIKKRRMLRSLDDMAARIADQKREMEILVTRATELKEKLGELTEARKAELEADYWVTKVKLMAAMDIASMGRLARETVEMMITMPSRLRNMIIPAIKSNGLIEWMERHE